MLTYALTTACGDDPAMPISPEPPDAAVDVDARVGADAARDHSVRDALNDEGRRDTGVSDGAPRDDAALGDAGARDGSSEVASIDALISDAQMDGSSSDAIVDVPPDAAVEVSDADAQVLADEDGAADSPSETVDASAMDASEPDASDALATEAGSDSEALDSAGDAEASEPPFDNPSCVGLLPTCGPTASQDCCHRATIAGGAFLRSYDGVGSTNASYGATVSSFGLDTFEVSVGRFRAFVQAGFGTQAKPPAAGSGAVLGAPSSGWSPADNSNLAADTAGLSSGLKCSAAYQTWTDSPSSNESRPINCVTWYEAFAFCVWDGARLPTEAEWNYAAAGGSEQRVYPWSMPASSTVISETNASYWMDPSRQCYGDGLDGCALTDVMGVGSKPAGRGRWGQSDLGGNVWEWTRDTFNNPYDIVNCTNCVDLSRDEMKVIRGGSFYGTSSTLLASGRSQGTATTRYYTVGIRCAR